MGAARVFRAACVRDDHTNFTHAKAIPIRSRGVLTKPIRNAWWTPFPLPRAPYK